MPRDQFFEVAVIGAGASGVLLAAQFGKLAQPGVRLALIGAGLRAGRGVAYETPFRSNLLNVPAGNMSAFPEDRGHFVHWLSTRLPDSDAATFAPRSLYGDYLAEILKETLQSDAIRALEGAATKLTRQDGLWTVHLADGSTLSARAVVLALGNLLIPNDPFDVSSIAPYYQRNPWAADAIRGLAPTAPVLLIGSGLTMVDVALSLRESGHRGPIHAVSRHGRLYLPHQSHSPRPLAQLPAEFTAPHSALRWIRAQIKLTQSEGGNWRAVIDSLRPHTSAIWAGWNSSQRASFVRHARNLWDIHRHRMAPEIATVLYDLIAQGVLYIHTARIIGAQKTGQAAQITLSATKTGNKTVLRVSRVINCTGPGRDYSKVDFPLVAHMRQQGWLTPDPLRLGIQTDPHGRLTAEDGSAVAGLFTLGPLRIPSLWESIAIPEIRSQAADLAKLLIAENIGARLAQP